MRVSQGLGPESRAALNVHPQHARHARVALSNLMYVRYCKLTCELHTAFINDLHSETECIMNLAFVVPLLLLLLLFIYYVNQTA